LSEELIMKWFVSRKKRIVHTLKKRSWRWLQAKTLGNKRLECIHKRVGKKRKTKLELYIHALSWARNPVLTIIEIHPIFNLNNYQ